MDREAAFLEGGPVPSLRYSTSRRDAAVLAIAGFVVWSLIERTDTCTRFFKYVASNPDLELDSAVLAGIVLSVGFAVFALRRWQECRLTEAAATNLAYHDELTGLPNRRAFLRALSDLCADPKATPFACIMFDIDNFKNANDTHGHHVGDELLRAIQGRVSAILPDGVFFSRLSGDEFALITPLEGRDLDRHIAELIRFRVGQPFLAFGKCVSVGASIGIARYPGDATDAVSLLRKSDMAVYQSKAAGRSCVTTFSADIDAAYQRHAKLEQGLREALKRGDVVPHYQPLIDLQTGNVIGFEVLARWTSEEFGPIGPQEFVPIASGIGLLADLSASIMHQACREAVSWKEPMRISFNIAPEQLSNRDFSTTFLSILTETGLCPSRVDIELTEEALLANLEVVSDVVMMLKSEGISFSLDDFGTGYSSLQHLQLIPFDTIKIDRSFVSKAQLCNRSRSLLEAIVRLGHAAGTKVLAEGVEEPEQAALLYEIGCDRAQGWLFGRADAEPKFSVNWTQRSIGSTTTRLHA